MSKLKWFIIGAMMVTVRAFLVGGGAKNDSESGCNSLLHSQQELP